MSINKSNEYTPGVSIEDVHLIMDETPARIWDELRNTNIFITGGTGFVGCWILEALAWANIHQNLNISITILTRNIKNFEIKAPHLCNLSFIEMIEGNVNDLRSIDKYFDVIIHAATDVAQINNDPVAIYNDIVNGTKETLELAKRSGAKQYLLTSSGAVYGPQPDDLALISEDYSGAPYTNDTRAAYGHGKRTSEFLATAYACRMSTNVKIARCFALLGPYLPTDAHFAAGNFIANSLKQEPIFIKGDGTAMRSYLYAADMVVWLLTVLINGANQQSYNLGSDQGISIADLANKISRIGLSDAGIQVTSKPLNDGKTQRYIPAISKIKHELGVDIYTDLDLAIKKTLAWHSRSI